MMRGELDDALHSLNEARSRGMSDRIYFRFRNRMADSRPMQHGLSRVTLILGVVGIVLALLLIGRFLIVTAPRARR
jgi:hypothetical protein